MSLEIIDANGRVAFTTDSELDAILLDGHIRTIHLDANLALDLAKTGDGRFAQRGSPIATLIQVAVATETAVDYDLGLEELALGAARASGDVTRLTTLKRQVTAGLREIETDLGYRAGSTSVGHIGRREIDSYLPVHTGFYTHLLRIEQIARQNLSKAAAVSNLAEYAKWANGEVKNISAHCLQVALDVFGGEPRAARLLSITSTKPQESRAWNAAWDLIHAFAMHYETAQPIGSKMKRTFLATRDKALSYVAQRCVVAAFVRASPLGDTTLAGYRFDQPFYADRRGEVEEVLGRTMESQRERIDRADSATRRDMVIIRNQLERALGIATEP